MNLNSVKTSSLIPYQLPEYIRDDPDNYGKFTEFLQAYYQWLEQEGNVLDFSNNLLNYSDIDRTTSQFMEYFANDFLQYFPETILASKSDAIKLARQLYHSKGTPASYKLLFRLLYNSDFDILYTKDFVLKASTSTWSSTKSLRLSSTNEKFLQAVNYRIFGSISKSIATIEDVLISEDTVEIIISNMERLFQSGETVTIVDNDNQIVLFDGESLSAEILGQINQINVDPNNRGLLYKLGDPVIVYGGLNPNILFPKGATAVVGDTTNGSLNNLNLVNGGYGFRPFPYGSITIPNSSGANAIITSVDTNSTLSETITVPSDTIYNKQNITLGSSNYGFSNVATSNANTTLANALSFQTFTTYPILSTLLINGGSNISKIPEITAHSLYSVDNSSFQDILDLGILGPIIISNGGVGYRANDTITFSGGTGFGAYANVVNVSASGAITSVKYISKNGYFTGGLGYSSSSLPTLNVISSNTQAHGASLYVPSLLGTGASFEASVIGIGSINTINITDYGRDYTSKPEISLKVQDILVSNTTVYNVPLNGDIVYQGTNFSQATYTANVYSTTTYVPDTTSVNSIFGLRVYNYNSIPNPILPLKFVNSDLILNIVTTGYAGNSFFSGSPSFDSSGTVTYGNGKAIANASFLNGLTISQGQYLDTTGQPSAYSVLQNEEFNNFTYKITVQKEISKYRKILLDLLHPTGTKVLGRYALKSNASYMDLMSDALFTGKPLSGYTGSNNSDIRINTNFTNQSNNIIVFDNLSGANIGSFIFAGQSGVSNSVLEIITPYGPNVKSEVINVNWASNTVTIKNNVWLTYSNVAYASTISGSSIINISTITNSYDLINSGRYSDPVHPLKDIVFTSDKISLNGVVYTVQSVDYANGIITTANTINQNVANSLLSVNRTYSTNNVRIFGSVGFEYIPELVTEQGYTLTTQDNKVIILE